MLFLQRFLSISMVAATMMWLAMPAAAADLDKVRVGVLKFGTVHWHLTVLQEKGLMEAEGIDLDVVALANKSALNVALQGGAADVIVTDWLWVSHQRGDGKFYTFSPYSLAVGAIMVRPDAGIETLADLRGRKIGVAGGPVDKSWLLLRAYSEKTLGEDVAPLVEPNFAAPPLLNELIKKGDLPAVLNFWHYNARLQAAGMKQLIGVADILPALGVEGEVPLLGWVFDENWAREHKDTVVRFLRAAKKGRELMAESDDVWELLKPQMKAEDEAIFHGSTRGLPRGASRNISAPPRSRPPSRFFAILAELGGEKTGR